MDVEAQDDGVVAKIIVGLFLMFATSLLLSHQPLYHVLN
jgi:hypothetical protein